MKLSIVLIFLSILNVFSNESYSQKKVTFDLENVKIKYVLNEIKSQTGFKFLYRAKEINVNQKISFKASQETIPQILDRLFENKKIEYKIIENQIVLTKKVEPKREQEREIEGTIKDSNGVPLSGANVILKGTTIGAQADFDGKFVLTIPDDNNIIVVSYLGYKTIEVDITGKTSIEIILPEDAAQLDSVVLVGSRGKPRTSFDSPVPIDNIKLQELQNTGKGIVDQQLMFKVPSYNSTQQPISDAAAHFSPADLRGLLPSRTLVLVNGKRKNASALVYSYVTPGRGEVGVDMKAIPSAALKSVEILRDGAAAQYGSDAVAGVINLVLEKNMDPFINTSYSTTTKGDGEQMQLESGFGVKITDKGYANFTFNYLDQKRSQRAGTITSLEDEASYWGIPAGQKHSKYFFSA